MSALTPSEFYQMVQAEMAGNAGSPWAFSERCDQCHSLIVGARFFRRGRKVWLLGKTERRSEAGFVKYPPRAYLSKPVGEPVGCPRHRDTWRDFQ